MDDIIENAKVIELDVEEIENNCNKINCNPIYETLKSILKLFIDLFKCCKPKNN
jgi:hypothetical protein